MCNLIAILHYQNSDGKNKISEIIIQVFLSRELSIELFKQSQAVGIGELCVSKLRLYYYLIVAFLSISARQSRRKRKDTKKTINLFKKVFKSKLSIEILMKFNHVVTEKSDFQDPAKSELPGFWHAVITERGVAAKIFSKLLCYFCFMRNQNTKKLIPKSRKKNQLILYVINSFRNDLKKF